MVLGEDLLEDSSSSDQDEETIGDDQPMVEELKDNEGDELKNFESKVEEVVRKVTKGMDDQPMEEKVEVVQDNDRPIISMSPKSEFYNRKLVNNMDKAFNRLTTITLGIMRKGIFGMVSGVTKARKVQWKMKASQAIEEHLDKVAT